MSYTTSHSDYDILLCCLWNLEEDLVDAAAEADDTLEDIDSFYLFPNYSLQIVPTILYK